MLRSRVWVQQLHSEDVNKQTKNREGCRIIGRIANYVPGYNLFYGRFKSFNVSFQVSCPLLGAV